MKNRCAWWTRFISNVGKLLAKGLRSANFFSHVDAKSNADRHSDTHANSGLCCCEALYLTEWWNVFAKSYRAHFVQHLRSDLGMVADGDIVLAFSASGETEELLRVLTGDRALSSENHRCLRRETGRTLTSDSWTATALSRARP